MSEPLLRPTYTNKYDRAGNYQYSNRELSAAVVSVGGAGLAFSADVFTLTLESIARHNHIIMPVDSLRYGLTYHSGDFVNGYFDALLPAMILAKIAGNMSYKSRTAVSSGISIASILLAEVPQLSGLRPDAINGFTLFGHAELADIPAGILGVMAFAGATLLAGKIYRRGKF